MESKLEAYRLRKRRKETFDKYKEKIKSMLSFGIGPNEEEAEKLITKIDITNDKEIKGAELPKPSPIFPEYDAEVITTTDEEAETDSVKEPHPSDADPHTKWIKYTLWAVYFLFWATCFAIAIELQFGIVYLMFSALFGIYFNTRTGPKKGKETSAYSVFNENCYAIDGSLKAEQFESEIRHGFNSVR